MRKNISFMLNGEYRDVDVSPNDTLLDVLREKMGVKSPKIGCDRGDCGTCTILLDGKTAKSCLILAIEVDGHSIVTVEGLCKEKPTKLQETFVENNAFQCGFCAPGFVLSGTELLERNSSPTEHEVKEAISGNLCRCTGYQPIIDSIMEAAKHINK
jgi:carbon-monoxide dehydrogenase small subunit